MIEPQELRAIVAVWWEDTFVNDYVIDRSGNYRNAEDCIEDIVIRARAALVQTEPIDPDKEKAAAAVERKLLPWLEQEAALAQPEPEGPTEAEIHALADELLDGDRASRVDFARAALARWGRPTPQPADGEVAELVAWMRDLYVPGARTDFNRLIARAAELLEQQQHLMILSAKEYEALSQRLQPIPVSERLPGPEDCASWPDEPDATPWCWSGSDADGAWSWEQRSAGECTYHHRFYTHWLPAHALPLPAGEVGHG